ncbi:glycerate kinase [Arthrobacter pigmenti]
MSGMQVLVAPDKFKGSLTATEVAHWLQSGLTGKGASGDISCRTLPLADGGDGSVQAALDAGFHALTIPITGPTGVPAATRVAFDGYTAVVEVATTSGLHMLPGGRLAPAISSSVGFGEAIRSLLADSPRRIVLALGGSATTDGGAGMLSALGVVFRDEFGSPFIPTGGTLRQIAHIDFSDLVPFDGVELIAAADVDNELLGQRGTAAVFGPQKGANAADIQILETGLVNLIARLDDASWPGTVYADAPGSGSAGGIGHAVMMLGAKAVSGADFFLDLLEFDRYASVSDLIITGEGKLDEQTLSGKLPLAVARRAAPVPVIAVVGHNALEADYVPTAFREIHALSSLTDLDCAMNPELSASLLCAIGQRIAWSQKSKLMSRMPN